MKTLALSSRIILIALTALLALPAAPIVSPTVAKPRTRIITREFRNPAPMNIPVSQALPVSASLYPSPISVSGIKGKLRDVNIVLPDFTHANGADLNVLLVGPRGQTAVLMADVGEETEGNGPVTLRFDDEAAGLLPDEIILGGTFRPTNHNNRVVAFNPPAPVAGASSVLSVFDGADPDGRWHLYVQDAFMGDDVGSFAGGWELEIQAEVKVKNRRKR